MTYSVLTQIDENWVALKFIETGLISTAHMSSADTLTHARFKEGSNVRVVNSADHSVIHYELNRKTHHVDEHGQVRPIRKLVGHIDMTPTWRAILPYLLLGIENGNAEGRKIAIEELQRMADAADAYNKSVDTNR